MKYLHRIFDLVFFPCELPRDDALELVPGLEVYLNDPFGLDVLLNDRELRLEELVRPDPRDPADAEAFALLRLEWLLPLLVELFLLDPRLPDAPFLWWCFLNPFPLPFCLVSGRPRG